MTPELWQRLKPLFDAVLREGAESRAAFIDTVCSDDLDLKVHLKSLLDAEQQDPGLEMLHLTISTVSSMTKDFLFHRANY